MLADFVGGFYENSRGFDYQRCINWYPSFSESNSKTHSKLVGVPGKRIISTATPSSSAGCRGLHQTINGRSFGVWGNTLYEFDYLGTLTDRNPSLRFGDSGNVSFTDNAIRILIKTQTAGYVFDLPTNTLTKVTDGDFLNTGNQVECDNGYFLMSVPGDNSITGSNAFYVSASDDPFTWSALDFQPMSSYDKISGIAKAGSDIWVFGENTIEAYRLSSGSGFPYIKIEGSERDVGTRNPWAIGKMNERVYFLGSNKDGYGAIWRTNGYGVEIVSTEAINNKINSIGITTDAVAYTYQEKGHYFYIVTIPSLGITLAYDETTNKWHERAFWNTTLSEFRKDRASHYCFAHGKNWVASSFDNNLYRLDSNYYLDGTDYIKRLRVSPHLKSENRKVRYNKIELEFERGQGLISGQGSSPLVMYRYSDDGGYTWEPEQTRSLGVMGEYDARAIWWSQGIGRDRLHEISLSDPIFPDIYGMYMDMEVL